MTGTEDRAWLGDRSSRQGTESKQVMGAAGRGQAGDRGQTGDRGKGQQEAAGRGRGQGARARLVTGVTAR